MTTNQTIDGVPRKCRECGSTSLSWFAQNTVPNGIQQNRLNTNDVQCVFVLGCDDCSETLKIISADKIAEHFNKPVAQPQGEPVAWKVEVDGMTLHHREPMDHPRAKNTPLYERPAPAVPIRLLADLCKPLVEDADLHARISARDELRKLLGDEGVWVASAPLVTCEQHMRVISGSEQPAPVSDLLEQIERLKTENMQLIQASTSRLMGEIVPVAVVMPEREAMRNIIAQAIGGDAYDCTRVWSAWGVGTMSDDDFIPIVDQEERLYEIADACLDEVTRLNTKE